MNIIGRFNPISNQYHSLEKFKDLPAGQKILTIGVAVLAGIITLPFLGLGSVAAFRHMVDRYSINPVEETSPKVQEAAKKAARASSQSFSNPIEQPIDPAIQTDIQNKIKEECQTLHQTFQTRTAKLPPASEGFTPDHFRVAKALYEKTSEELKQEYKTELSEESASLLIRSILGVKEGESASFKPQEIDTEGKNLLDWHLSTGSENWDLKSALDQTALDLLAGRGLLLQIGDSDPIHPHNGALAIFQGIRDHYLIFLRKNPLAIEEIKTNVAQSEFYQKHTEGKLLSPEKFNEIFGEKKQQIEKKYLNGTQLEKILSLKEEEKSSFSNHDEIESLIRMKTLEILFLTSQAILSQAFSEIGDLLAVDTIGFITAEEPYTFRYSEDLNSLSIVLKFPVMRYTVNQFQNILNVTKIIQAPKIL